MTGLLSNMHPSPKFNVTLLAGGDRSDYRKTQAPEMKLFRNRKWK